MLKDTKANKIFLIACTIILALLFFSDVIWQKRGKEQRWETSYSYATTEALSIETMSNNVILAIDPTVQEILVSIGKNDSKSLKTSVKDKKLSLVVTTLPRGFLRFFSSQNTPLLVTLPPIATLKTVEISTIQGDILFLQDFQADSLSVSTVSGSVDMLNLEAAHMLSIATISGDIEGYSVSSRDLVNLNTTSGNLEIDRVAGKQINLSTVSGSIETRIELPSQGSLEGSSVSGDLKLDFQDSDNIAIQASHVQGTILLQGEKQPDHSVSTLTGKALTNITLTTVSGELAITF